MDAAVNTLILKGAISEMPEAERTKIKECIEKLKAIVAENGNLGLIALSLVSVETLAQMEKK